MIKIIIEAVIGFALGGLVAYVYLSTTGKLK